ncbi:MAG: MFS transporter [Clostridia bacterium]|nr:MFS transporter [Clostridia bacterium]NCC83509.1 MFS transporter [Clostridia bacterium]
MCFLDHHPLEAYLSTPTHSGLISRLARSNRFYYGWIILVLSSLSYFFSAPGQTYFTSTFIDIYIQEFGWTRSTISGIYSLATMTSGLLLFWVGRQIDRFGQKAVSLVVAALLGLTCIWLSLVNGLPMLFLGFLASRYLGQGSMTLLPATLLPNWFAHRRPLAFSLMSVGGVIGSSFLPPLNRYLIDTIGWRMVWRLWAIAFGVVFIPLVAIFMRNHPREVGLTTAGEYRQKSSSDAVPAKFQDVPSWTLKEAIRTRAYWGMLYSQLLLPLIVTGLTFHFISIMKIRSISPDQAAYLISLLAVVSFPTTLFAGWILSKVQIHHTAMAISLFMGLALTVLLLTDGLPGALVFTILLGSAMGLQTVWGGLVWPNYFGTRYLGSIRSLAMSATVLGSAFGPIPLGLTFDLTGSYNSALIGMIGLTVLGIAAAAGSPRPIHAERFKNDDEYID